jgi:NAD(P)-dependent dehydrogenase (short-subunit alcohol dehydrogenase family)
LGDAACEECRYADQLTGNRVLVTGANSGIGEVIALALADAR